MFEKIKKLFKKTPAKSAKPAEIKEKPEKVTKSAKELATEKGEPYVTILSLDLDPENLHAGAFELDWNDKFIANLVRAGYQKDPRDTDSDVVDRWFQNVCRHVVMETWEQEQAMNPQRYVRERNIGGGRKEVS
jgi:hypothetical protein